MEALLSFGQKNEDQSLQNSDHKRPEFILVTAGVIPGHLLLLISLLNNYGSWISAQSLKQHIPLAIKYSGKS